MDQKKKKNTVVVHFKNVSSKIDFSGALQEFICLIRHYGICFKILCCKVYSIKKILIYCHPNIIA